MPPGFTPVWETLEGGQEETDVGLSATTAAWAGPGILCHVAFLPSQNAPSRWGSAAWGSVQRSRGFAELLAP